MLRSSAALLVVFASALPAQIDATLLSDLKARSIGPAGMSGRVVAIDAVENNPTTVYAGAATGGLWKSTNGGLTFTPIFDDQPVASIGAIEIYQQSPDIVWVGTGEGNPRNSVSVGNGVYKSTDGGRSWQHLGLDKTERIRRIWVHPGDPDVALVAALGTSWGENPQRGLYKTTDGGKSWQNILHVDEKTGCIDIQVDPNNPRKMFASMWEHRRWPWSFHSGGKGSALYRSVDGGRNWDKLGTDDGFPKGDLGRIKAAFAPSNPDIVYALVEAEKSVLLRSDDGGFKFKTVNKDSNIAPRPFYYCDLAIDPKNPDRIYNIHSMVTVSTDGGKTFGSLIGWGQAHPDHHAMWIDPNNPKLIYDGNDGGFSLSRDQGKTWDFATQLPLAQFYHVAVDMDVPYNVYGGLQDNGSWRGPNTVWENGGIRNFHWDELCFGDGFATLPDPTDSKQGYAMSQGGSLVRWNLHTGQRQGIKPIGPEGIKLRFNWNAAIAQDPFDTKTIYYGSQFVHKSTDRGNSWETISEDLTSNHPQWQKQSESGGLTLDVTGAENYTTLMTIAPSAVKKGVIWSGSDDGRVHVTQDGGGSWASLESRINGLPRNTWCPHIEASKYDAGTAFAVFDDHRRSNWTPYLYKTTDYGQTWQNLATDDVRGYCLVVEQDPVDKNLLFLGTEFGLWISTDGGAHWNQFKNGFPTCSAMALVVHPRDHDLVIGTHGRAIFVIDDIRPLRGLSQSVQAEPLHLFPVPTAIQYYTKQTGASRFPGQGEFRGVTRPSGAMISFSANGPKLKHPDKEIEKKRRSLMAVEGTASKEKPVARVKDASTKKATATDGKPETDKAKPGVAKIEILDSKGKVIKKIEHAAKLGLNRAYWNLSRDSEDAPTSGGSRRGRRGSGGGRVLPGTYQVRVSLDGHQADGSITVEPDPRERATPADRLAKDVAIRRGQKMMARVSKVQERLKKVKTEVDAVTARLGRMDKKDKPEDLDKATKAAKKAITGFEKALSGDSDKQGITSRTGYMSEMGRGFYSMRSTWTAPTRNELTSLQRAETTVTKIVSEFNKLLKGPIADFVKSLDKNKLSFAPDVSEIK